MDCDVIVVGGGPVGLMLACELALAGVHPVVLERLSEPRGHDRAGVLHTRTLETLELRGLLEAFREGNDTTDGLPFGGIFEEGLRHSLIRTRHPHSLLIPQSRTERLLADHARELGVEVRRDHDVVGVDDTGEGVRVQFRTGPKEGALHAAYAVGCDGGHSSVRRLTGIPMEGTGATVGALIGYVTCKYRDVPMRWERIGDGILILAFPPEGGMGRVVAIEYGRPHPDRSAPVTLEELNAAVHRLSGRDLELTEPVLWTSRFSDASQQAERYRRGGVFLAGDAAHVHFPIGGQGLNTGLQDAVNLGWKLAGRLHGWGTDPLLDSYHEERHPVGASVLSNTRAQLALMAPDEEHTTPLRDLFTEILGFDQVNRYLAEMVTGVGIRYATGPKERSPLVGAFAPDLVTDSGKHWAELMREGTGVLVDAGAGVGDQARPWGGRVRVTGAAPGQDGVPADALLIRPDGYCAWAATEGESPEERSKGLEEALTLWFGPAEGERR